MLHCATQPIKEIIETTSIVLLPVQQLQQKQSDHLERLRSSANGSSIFSTPTTSPTPAESNINEIDNDSRSNTSSTTTSNCSISKSNCSCASPFAELEMEPKLDTTSESQAMHMHMLTPKAMQYDNNSSSSGGDGGGGDDDTEKQQHSLSNISNISVEINSTALSNENGTNDTSTPITKMSRPGTPMLMPQPSHVAATSPSIGVNLRVTGQCSQGGRKYMEDYFSVAYQEAKGGDAATEDNKELEYAFFGIYDGHGGAEAAMFAKENLMIEIVSQKLFWSDSDEDVLRAIREGYIATHFAMWREHESWPRTGNGHLSTAGTTATVAFLRREKIYIGHVGDSGVVLGYQNEHENFWRAKPLTTDHKPESHAERKRIHRSGGSVTVKSGVPRVVWNRPRDPKHRGPIRHNTAVDEIPFLAVARSLGDLWSYNAEYNEFVVSPDPDIKVVKIDPKTFRCLIFGTDGLWNVVNPQEAVDVVYEKEGINNTLRRVQSFSGAHTSERCLPNANPSKGLVEKALKTWSAKKMRADNTSVLTVILYPNKTHADMVCSEPSNISTKQAMPSTVANGIKSVTDFTHPSSLMHTDLNYGSDEILVKEYEHRVPYSVVAKKFLPPLEYRNFLYYEEMDNEEDLVIEEHYEVDEDEAGSSLPHMSILESAIIPNNGRCDWDHVCRKNLQKTCSCQSGSRAQFNVPETNEWVELEIDQDGDCNAISAEISTTTMVTKPTTADLSPTTILMAAEPIDMEYQILRDLVADENVNDELYGVVEDEEEEVFEETVDVSEIEVDVDVDVLEPSYEHGYMPSDECMDTDQSTTGYSFAESYNSLLNEQEARNSASNASSPTGAGGMASPSTNYQSIDTNCMQEILQEQQRYQQQEGYSLTKLETRREQQRNNVSCHVITGTENDDDDSDNMPTDMTAFEHVDTEQERGVNWRENFVTTTATESHCHQVATRNAREAQLIEFNSLLQQERDEEQRVALEQRTMQPVTMLGKYPVEEEVAESGVSLSSDVADVSVDCSSSSRIFAGSLADDNRFENYDEAATLPLHVTTENAPMSMSQSSQTTPTLTPALTPAQTSSDEDNTLQSNEVSSTDLHCTSMEYVKQKVEEIRQEDNSAVTYIFEQIQKLKEAEYTPVSKTVKVVMERAVAIASGRVNGSALESPDSRVNQTTMGTDVAESISATGISKLRRMRYRNVPNENIMQTRRRNRGNKFKRKQASYMTGTAAAIIAFNAPATAAAKNNNDSNHRRTHNSDGNENKNHNHHNADTANSAASPLNLTRNHSSASIGGGVVAASITVKRSKRSIGSASNSHNSTTASTVSASIIRSPYATRNEVRINKRQLRSTICNLDLTQRTLRTRNSLPKNVKANANSSRSLAASSSSQHTAAGRGNTNHNKNHNHYQKRSAVTTSAVSHINAVANRSSNANSMMNLRQQQQQQQQQKQQQQQQQAILGKRKTSERQQQQQQQQQQTATPLMSSPLTMARRSTANVFAQPAITYLNLRSRSILDESHAVASVAGVATGVAGNGKRLEYRRSMRRTTVCGNSSIGCNVGGGGGGGIINPNVGSFSKSTRLQSAIGAIAARPPPSPKKLTLTTIGNSRQTMLPATAAAVTAATAKANNNNNNNSGKRSNHNHHRHHHNNNNNKINNNGNSKATEVLVDFSKRWSLRSQRASGTVTLPFNGGAATSSVSTNTVAGIIGGNVSAAGLTTCNSLEGAMKCYGNINGGGSGNSSSTIATRTRLNRRR